MLCLLRPRDARASGAAQGIRLDIGGRGAPSHWPGQVVAWT